MKRICLFLIFSGVLMDIRAQDDPFKPEPLPLPVIKEITPDILQVGTVKLMKKAREVHIPVTIEMHEGPIEYLVVTGRGKVHESLFEPPPSLITSKWRCSCSTPKAAAVN